MASSGGPDGISNGCVLALDAANKISYPGSGTSWYDISGYVNNGTLTNGPIFNNNNLGNIVFDGVDDYVNCGNVLANLTDLSLECFVKFGTQSTNYNGIISKTLDNTNGWEIRTGNGKTSTTTDLQFRYVGDNAVVGFNTNFTNGIWYHIVATGTSGSQIVYINGIRVNSASVALSPSANSNSLSIGKLAYATLYTNMSIGYARIYNRALTAAEVLQNYNSTKSRFGL